MKDPGQIYQFKITLQGVRPPIWRRIQVSQKYSFWDLHVALQDAMGWLDCHLHLFRVTNPATGVSEEIGIPENDPFYDEEPCLCGWEIPLSTYFIKPNTRANYEYDFGDGWAHEVILEKMEKQKSGQSYPRCVAGKRACPPEDCGGPWGYEELLKTIGDPLNEEYASTIEWLGGSYDAEAFDPKQVNFDSPRERWTDAFGSD